MFYFVMMMKCKQTHFNHFGCWHAFQVLKLWTKVNPPQSASFIFFVKETRTVSTTKGFPIFGVHLFTLIGKKNEKIFCFLLGLSVLETVSLSNVVLPLSILPYLGPYKDFLLKTRPQCYCHSITGSLGQPCTDFLTPSLQKYCSCILV